MNRAARVGGIAHGGQVVLSERAWNLVNEEKNLQLLHSPVCKDLGKVALKGIEGEENIYQVLPIRLSERVFPLLANESKKKISFF